MAIQLKDLDLEIRRKEVSPLEKLVARLRVATKLLTLPELADLLSEDLSREDLESVIRFEREIYARNLIFKNDFVEFFCMCWKPGQYTQIHDHGDSISGTRIIEGKAVEEIFTLTGRKTLEVAKTGSDAILQEGSVSVAGVEGIHRVTNPAEWKTDLITLQIYSPPLKNWRAYNLKNE